jgi:hypothetical protein
MDYGHHHNAKLLQTVELTRLQVRTSLEDPLYGRERIARLAASTIAEIEHLLPFLQEAVAKRATIDVCTVLGQVPIVCCC